MRHWENWGWDGQLWPMCQGGCPLWWQQVVFWSTGSRLRTWTLFWAYFASGKKALFYICAFFKSLFIYFERERGRDRERRQRESQAGSTVSVPDAVPDAGLEPPNHEIMIWAQIKRWMLNQLSHPGAPLFDQIFPFLGEFWQAPGKVPGTGSQEEAHVKDSARHLGDPLSRAEMGLVTYYSENLSIWKVCFSELDCI